MKTHKHVLLRVTAVLVIILCGVSLLRYGTAPSEKSVPSHNALEPGQSSADRQSRVLSPAVAKSETPDPAQRSDWAIPYGKEFWDQSSGTALPLTGIPTLPLNIAATIDRVTHAFMQDTPGTAPTVRGDNYAARLENGGLVFTADPPAKADALRMGHPSPEAAEARLRTMRVDRGGSSLLGATAAGEYRVIGNTAQRLLNPDAQLVEHYASGAAGINLTWILQAPPAGTGNLTIEVGIDGLEASEQTERGVHFADAAGVARLCFGHVTVVQASGKRITLPVELAANGVRAEIPEVLLAADAFPLAIDPAISPEFGVDQPVTTGPSAGFQGPPRIASLGSNFLMVWADRGQVFGARISHSGVLLDPNALLIAPSGTLPDVAANGSHYFVVWTAPDQNNVGVVRGTLVSANGDVSNPSGTRLAGGSNHQRAPRLASNGQTFLVAWPEDTAAIPAENERIVAVRVSAGGAPLDLQPLGISSAPGLDPEVASAGGNYLVVWRTSRLFAARVSAAGAVLDTQPIVLDSTDNSSLVVASSSVASDGKTYLIAWTRAPQIGTAVSEVRAVRLKAGGALVNGAPVVLAQGSFLESATAVADDTGYLVLWTDSAGVNFGHVELWGTRIPGGGSPIVPNASVLLTRSTELFNLDLHAYPNGFFAVWNEFGTLLSGDLFGVLMDKAGVAAGAPTRYGFGPNSQYGPALASNGDGYLAVWEDYRFGETPALYAARLDASGLTLDPISFVISAGPERRSNPAVASNGRDYLVVWEDFRNEQATSDIFGTRVTTTGTVLDPDGLVISAVQGTQHLPAVASDGQDYFVAWHDQRPGSIHRVFGSVVTSNAQVRPPGGRLVTSVGIVQNNVTLAGNSNGYFAVWEDRRNFATTLIDLYGTRLNRDGGVLDSTNIPLVTNVTVQLSPELVSDGHGFLLAWAERNTTGQPLRMETWATRLDASGNVLDPAGIFLAGGTILPTVATRGTDYLVVSELSSGRGGLVGTLISRGGELTDAFQLTGTNVHRSSATAAAGGRYLVAFEGTFSGETVRIRAHRLDTIGQPLVMLSRTLFPYPEASGPMALDPNVRFQNSDAGLPGGRLRVSFAGGNGLPEDSLSVQDSFLDGLQATASTVFFQELAVGRIDSDGMMGRPLVITFLPGATQLAVETILRHVSYENLADNPDVRLRIIEIAVTDAAQVTSPPQNITVQILSVKPTFVKGPNVVVDEDAGFITKPWATQIHPDVPTPVTFVFMVETDNPQLFQTLPQVSPSGLLSFASAQNAHGVARITVMLVVDGRNMSDLQTFTITVRPINDPPQVQAFQVAVAEDGRVEFSLRATDPDSDPLQYRVTSPAHGTLTGQPPLLTYQPRPNFSGVDQFFYSVNDGRSQSQTARVDIVVSPINDLPVARLVGVPSRVIAPNERSVTLLIDGTHSRDPDGSSLAYFWFVDGQRVQPNPADAAGTLTTELSLGQHTIALKVSDDDLTSGDMDTATATVNVLTPRQAVSALILQVTQARLSSKTEKSLLHRLEEALEAFRDSDPDWALEELEDFQRKVHKSKPWEINSALAAAFVESAQQIIDAYILCDLTAALSESWRALSMSTRVRNELNQRLNDICYRSKDGKFGQAVWGLEGIQSYARKTAARGDMSPHVSAAIQASVALALDMLLPED